MKVSRGRAKVSASTDAGVGLVSRVRAGVVFCRWPIGVHPRVASGGAWTGRQSAHKRDYTAALSGTVLFRQMRHMVRVVETATTNEAHILEVATEEIEDE